MNNVLMAIMAIRIRHTAVSRVPARRLAVISLKAVMSGRVKLVAFVNRVTLANCVITVALAISAIHWLIRIAPVSRVAVIWMGLQTMTATVKPDSVSVGPV